MEPPELNVGSWIEINGRPAIVALLYPAESRAHSGLGIAVYNPDKPTSRDFDWNGTAFFLPARPDFGGYAERTFPAAASELKQRYKKR